MAAGSLDLTSPSRGRKRRRMSLRLPQIRTGPFGGGLGLLVVVVGLVAIGVGWNGMAGAGGQVNHVSDLRAQMPWLVSGGVLGLALVVFGAALIVVHNARADRARLEAKLDELIVAASRPPAASLAGTAGAQAAPAAAAATAADVYVAGGSAYHRADCRLVEGRDDLAYVTQPETHERGLRACRVCLPADNETATF